MIQPAVSAAMTRALILGLMACSASGCPTMSVTQFEPGPVSGYPHVRQERDLVVAVQPLVDRSEIQKIFQSDLLDRGILPVLIVAENSGHSSGYIVSREHVYLARRGAAAVEAVLQDEVESGTAGEAVAMVGAPLLSLPLLVVGLKMSSDAQVIEHNLRDKELQTQTLSPGEHTHGFVYFQIPDGRAPPKRGYQIILRVTESMTGEPFVMDFPID